MEAFRQSGGKIEVLGTTRSLLRIDAEAEPTPPAAPAKQKSSRSR